MLGSINDIWLKRILMKIEIRDVVLILINFKRYSD